LTALFLTAIVAVWGVADREGLAAFAQAQVAQQFCSPAWFIMLTASLSVITVVRIAFLLPLTVDLSKETAQLSNIAMVIAVVLMVYILVVAPTHFLMNGIVDSVGTYLSSLVRQSFATFPFFGKELQEWFHTCLPSFGSVLLTERHPISQLQTVLVPTRNVRQWRPTPGQR
jgi:choline-glycine betaine transporter